MALVSLLLAACVGGKPADTHTGDTAAAGDTGDTAADTDTGDTATGDTDTAGPDTGDTAADTGSGDTASGGDCADLPLCDGFEGAAAGGSPDPALWTVVSPDCSGTGTLVVDDAVAHTGTRSLRVDGGGGWCDHVFARNTSAVAAVQGPLHVRFFLRLGEALGDGHVTILALADADDGGSDVRLGGQAGVLVWNRASDDATLPVLSPAGIATSVGPDAGRWHCVEVALDGAAGTLDTWVDGVAVDGLRVDGEPTADRDAGWLARGAWHPAPTDLRLGWESYHGDARTLWVDDVAVAGSPIGCD